MQVQVQIGAKSEAVHDASMEYSQSGGISLKLSTKSGNNEIKVPGESIFGVYLCKSSAQQWRRSSMQSFLGGVRRSLVGASRSASRRNSADACTNKQGSSGVSQQNSMLQTQQNQSQHATASTNLLSPAGAPSPSQLELGKKMVEPESAMIGVIELDAVPQNASVYGYELSMNDLQQFVMTNTTSYCGNVGSTSVGGKESFDLVIFYLQTQVDGSSASQIVNGKGRLFCLRLRLIQDSIDCVKVVQDMRQMFLNGHGSVSGAPDAKYTVIVNPFSGTKKAMQMYKQQIRPMLQLAQIQINLIVTERAGHASDIARAFDPHTTDAIILCGGDGIFHEFVNGLMDRCFDHGAKDFESLNAQKCLQVPLGYVPCGSGNALGKNINCPTVPHAVLNVIKRHCMKTDLFSFEYLSVGTSQQQKRHYGFLEIMWTLVADIDIESDKIRWAGGLRFTIWAVMRILKLRKYSGSLYLFKDGMQLDRGNELIPQLESAVLDSKQTVAITEREFTYFMAMNMPWCATDFLVAPLSQLDDGQLDLYWMHKDAGRGNLLKVLLDTESGQYVNYPFVHHAKCSSFILIPGSSGSPLADQRQQSQLAAPLPIQEELQSIRGLNGIIDVDGEKIKYDGILVECLPRVLNLIVPQNLSSINWFSTSS
ncbi:hypothetical protein MP228_011292 [Amoeboaphelidium protococcarum]|nr:hypothetical protein MP228_011292 [Amoeboaphelidium protococcarum]